MTENLDFNIKDTRVLNESNNIINEEERKKESENDNIVLNNVNFSHLNNDFEIVPPVEESKPLFDEEKKINIEFNEPLFQVEEIEDKQELPTETEKVKEELSNEFNFDAMINEIKPEEVLAVDNELSETVEEPELATLEPASIEEPKTDLEITSNIGEYIEKQIILTRMQANNLKINRLIDEIISAFDVQPINKFESFESTINNLKKLSEITKEEITNSINAFVANALNSNNKINYEDDVKTI